MTVKEFVDGGYLFKVNRDVLHPLGLALTIVEEDDGSCTFGEIMDCRDDLDGIIFDEIDADLKHKHDLINAETTKRILPRSNALGYWVQPVEPE